MKLFNFFTIILLTSIIYASDNTRISKFVNDIYIEVSVLLEDGSADSPSKQNKLKSIIIQNSDLKSMANFTLGHYKKSMSNAQYEKFLSAYKIYTLSYCGSIFKKFKNQKFNITRIANIGNNRYSVTTKIIGANNSRLQVDFIVVEKNGKFLVFDLVTEGVSLITSQKTEFDNILMAGKVNDLINRLQNARD